MKDNLGLHRTVQSFKSIDFLQPEFETVNRMKVEGEELDVRSRRTFLWKDLACKY